MLIFNEMFMVAYGFAAVASFVGLIVVQEIKAEMKPAKEWKFI